MFTANENSRRPPGARLQNGKLDLGGPRNDASWAFGTQAPSRTGGPSFAQTIGGGSQSRPFDPSEFPSLGGGTQQSGIPSAWAANVRPRSPERRQMAGYGRGAQTANRGTARSPYPTQVQDQPEPIGYTGRQDQHISLHNDDPSSTPTASQHPPDQLAPSNKRLSEMSDRERYGMAGLLARMNPEHPDHNPLLSGIDLTKLGINMDQSEPLIDTWAGPFDEQNFVVPDFHLPAAYTVTNVPSLASKIDSFSDETLIMIFYDHPRDIAQELAAQQLYKRDWRWHKVMRCWMMKDPNQQMHGYGQGPIRLSDKSERGMYIFFDINNWRRERKEIVLNFDDLDTRPSLMQGTGLTAAAAAAAASANGLGRAHAVGGFAAGGLGAAFGGVGGA
ncbi:hypothetical protein, variant [Verruconis gallopava]|uniref:NOT2/NOT3/NOT5 C-terminal domain-containing protein n=1 Tax=Verruconis gallopava TaxID=253628 RepID=A0A0D2AFV4_9PEZI|nr:hypothetical protein, variant [Verruconis gallopava]KIW05853.1 hypothetical protein, variant [Verruconis gallopava]